MTATPDPHKLRRSSPPKPSPSPVRTPVPTRHSLPLAGSPGLISPLREKRADGPAKRPTLPSPAAAAAQGRKLSLSSPLGKPLARPPAAPKPRLVSSPAPLTSDQPEIPTAPPSAPTIVSVIDESPSQGTVRRLPGDLRDIDTESWELRTETAVRLDDFDDDSVGDLQVVHHKQLTHYRNLLVRAQTASSSAIHDLHTKLLESEARLAALQAEHSQCLARAEEERRIQGATDRAAEVLKRGGNLGSVVRDLSKDRRIDMLGYMVEACHPSDVNAQIALLEKYRRSRVDILGKIGDKLAVDVLALLDVQDLLRFRQVSRRSERISRLPDIWRIFCRQLEWRDWDGRHGLAHLDKEPDIGWEQLYRNLWRRERNWNRGLAQKILVLSGHTNYVTSLRLRNDVLSSGSYDETIRIWHLPSIHDGQRAHITPLTLPAKSVACLDYFAPAGVFVAGSHDIGRVQVWQQTGETWSVTQTLAGHLHGIRAVAINDRWMVSAGADKALVVWDWRSGEKIVRFGQQTNICVGIQLIHDYILAVTVDGVIRTFSIAKREMLAQFRLADLSKEAKPRVSNKVKDVGGGIGGSGMVTWFEGQGRFMTCATRDMIIRLAWDEVEEPVQPPITVKSAPSVTSSPRLERLRKSSASTTPLPQTPPRLRTVSSGPLLNRSPNSHLRSSPSLGPSLPSTSLSRVRPISQRAISSPVTSSSTTSRKSPASTRPSSVSAKVAETPNQDLGVIAEGAPSVNQQRFVPLLIKAPKLLEVVEAPEIERGAVDARRTRLVTSTRFAARAGADRQLYVGASGDSDSELKTIMMHIRGAWAAEAEGMGLQTPGKNPMSIVMDRDKLVYGCTDGSIVVVGFAGEAYS